MERRAAAELRAHGKVSKGEHILLVDDGSKEAKVGERFFRSIVKEVPCTIDVKRFSSPLDPRIDECRKDYEQIVIPWDADDEALMTLQHICEGKPTAGEGGVKLLRRLLDSEVSLAADLLGIAFEETPPDNPVKPLLDNLEALYPGTKFSLCKALD